MSENTQRPKPTCRYCNEQDELTTVEHGDEKIELCHGHYHEYTREDH